MGSVKLHLVDGTYELFRAHFSKRPDHRAPEGYDAKATVGLVHSMLALLSDSREEVTHIAIAFDNPIRSFRNDLYDGYKTEEGVPEELLRQFAPVEEAAAAIGLTVWAMDQWEADDALATAAARFSRDVEQVRILSPDKDLGQCIVGRKVVQVDRRQDKEVDEDALREAKGIAPASIPDWLALVGDSADGIPGIKGFGEKGASALLGVYGTIESIPASAEEWTVKPRGAATLAATLHAERDNALLYRKLATLVRDVPLKESLDELRWRGVPRSRFSAWCKKMGAESLLTRPNAWNELG